MAINARNVPNNSGPRPDPMDPGTYPARLVSIIDLGIQPQEFNGEEKAPKQEIMVTYEFLDEFLKDEDGEDIEDKPRWLSETFTLNSLDQDKAKSTQRYYALDSTEEYGGDWEQLLDSPAMITVVHNIGKGKNAGRIYEKVANVSAMRAKEASKAKPLVNPTRFFDMSEPDVELFLSLPDWVQKKIKDGLEFSGSPLDELLKKHKGKGDAKKEQKKDKKATVKNEEAEDEADKDEEELY